MYYNWLDRWDERQAQRGDVVKEAAEFVLDADLAFPGTKEIASIEEFCAIADRALADLTFFNEPSEADPEFQLKDGWLKFPSDVATDIEENNVVWAKVTESGSLDQALVVFHHWNARSRQPKIANFFSRRGISVAELAMPYHFERSRPGSAHADYMLSPNLGRTLQSMRQAVLDGRRLIYWLKSLGYGEIAVLGMSLGSWVAGLIAAHDPAVSKASLFLSGGSLADMVWTGRATRLIHQSLESEIELSELRRAWGPISLENHAHKLARPNLDLQIVLAKRDKVVLPHLSEMFVSKLTVAGARPDVLELNCGHYSLAMPPYILLAGLRLKRLLMRTGGAT